MLCFKMRIYAFDSCTSKTGSTLVSFLFENSQEYDCVENDVCEGAIRIGGDNNFPFSVSGSTAHATVDRSVKRQCPGTFSLSNRGVYYAIAASKNGSCITATAEGRSFNTVMAVYEGRSCGELRCLASGHRRGTSTSKATWVSEPGTSYTLQLAGEEEAAGEYKLSVKVGND